MENLDKEETKCACGANVSCECEPKTFTGEEIDFIKKCIKVYWEYHSNRVHPDNQNDWNISQNILNK